MNKLLIIAPMLFVSITVIGLQNRFNKIFTASKTISAEIDLHIQSDNKYLSSAYDEATAQIHVTVTKISGSKRIVVWEKDFKNMQLKNYSNNSNTETLMIPNLAQSKEKLEVTYTVTYNSNGSVLQLANEAVINASSQKGDLVIEI
ncbi:MAG: hypothetical protein ACTHJ5_05140 [Ilyomonas sp.]